MASKPIQIRRPVRRHNAQMYLLITLLSFSLSVIITRLVLTLTGFPKIGSGEFHFAHLLWGGLLLFVATILMLVFENRWMYMVSALLAGIGVGLFIDEVGKFITANNDYFYPLAIPIIYAFALLVVVLYLQVNRPESTDQRAEMYRALEMFGELLDRDLEPKERADLEARLLKVSQQSDVPDIGRLAGVLLEFISSSEVQIAPQRVDLITGITHSLQAFEEKYLGPKRLKILISAGMGILGVGTAIWMILLLVSPQSSDHLRYVLTEMINAGQIRGMATLNLFIGELAVETGIGLLLIIASVLLIIGQERRGHSIGYLTLLMSLTIFNLLVFYFDQFGNILLTLVELALLLGLIQYRERYLEKPEKQKPPQQPQS